MPSSLVIVIGAGAGGMMAAGRAAECGARVTLLEKTDGPGKKILISGQTRGNVTNARPLEEFNEMYGKNGRFLFPAFRRFFRDDLMDFLGRCGVPTATESDGRIFPASGKAQDVVGALVKYLEDNGVSLHTRTCVTGIKVEQGRVKGDETPGGVFTGQAIILATGGASYPGTGSSGDGYRMAAALGHTIVPLRPALVPLMVQEVERARRMQGVSLRDVRVTAYRLTPDEIDPGIPVRDCGRGTGITPPRTVIESRAGDVIFTHFGLSGPAVLQMSLAVYDSLQQGPVSLAIDLRPSLTFLQLRQELQDYLDRYGKRTYRHILTGLLPEKMAAVFPELTRIQPDKPAHQISAAERDRLASALKSLRFSISGTLPLAAAMVTAGGVALDEIDPRTMQSKLVQGLFFCGEVMDIDADTGGFNLQAAFSTGFVAGEAAARTD
ncbi:MAG: NAD(P)/FAD-dependent oxidoreductase [Kiritimatiellota bacterium]|nr:NAD(P)/FAD-dependent oxidoreductase [Kiritimatiellota bacterium]